MDQYSTISETLFVTGPSSTGKTTLVKQYLDKHSKLHVYIDCAVLSTPSQLYSDIIKGLTEDDNLSVYSPISFATTLLSLLKKKKRVRSRKFHIVLDNAHWLKNTNLSSCLPLLLHLDEFFDEPVDSSSRYYVQLILVTSMRLDVFSNLYPPGIRDKIVSRCKVVALGPWSKKELIERISSCPPTLRPESYPTLVNNVVNLNYNYKTRDYIDLKYLCEMAFERFIQEFPNDEEIDMAFYKKNKLPDTMKELTVVESTKIGLSWDMMLLITGAYIASFSTSRDDKVNFVKSNRKTKRRKTVTDNFCQGIKPFTLERLLQIYRRLSDSSMHERVENSRREDLVDSILANIRTLIDLKFLRNVGEDGLGSLTKLSIADYVDYKYAKLLAKNCDVQLDDYLK